MITCAIPLWAKLPAAPLPCPGAMQGYLQPVQPLFGQVPLPAPLSSISQWNEQLLMSCSGQALPPCICCSGTARDAQGQVWAQLHLLLEPSSERSWVIDTNLTILLTIWILFTILLPTSQLGQPHREIKMCLTLRVPLNPSSPRLCQLPQFLSLLPEPSAEAADTGIFSAL